MCGAAQSEHIHAVCKTLLSLRMHEGTVRSGKSQELGHVKIGVCQEVEHPEICKSCYD